MNLKRLFLRITTFVVIICVPVSTAVASMANDNASFAVISIMQVLRTILALVFVCALAVLLLKKWGHRLSNMPFIAKGVEQSSQRNLISIVESQSLADGVTLQVVSIDTTTLLVSTSPAGVSVIGTIENGALHLTPTGSGGGQSGDPASVLSLLDQSRLVAQSEPLKAHLFKKSMQ